MKIMEKKTFLWLKKNQSKEAWKINMQKMNATAMDKLAVSKMIIVLQKIKHCNIHCSFNHK